MYNLHYLRVTVLEKFSEIFPEKTRTQILKLLSKSLAYKSYSHLKNEYRIDKDDNLIELSNSCSSGFIDISKQGFVFNTYALMEYFNINYKDAMELKCKIDNYKDGLRNLCSLRGVLFSPDLSLLKKILRSFYKIDTKRLMVDKSFEFYCRQDSVNNLIVDGKSSKTSFFWFDGFFVRDKKYFKGYLASYVVELFNEFLKYDNVIFLSDVVEYHEQEQTLIYKLIINGFDNYKVNNPMFKYGEGALFFPKK